MADSLQHLVDSLPDTADGIAAYLEGQGIKGIRRHGGACPLSQLLRVHGFVHACVAKYISDMGREQVEHTPATASFMIQFDGGRFPKLDAMAPRKME